MLNPENHAEVVLKYDFQKELQELLAKHKVHEEIRNTKPSIIGDIVVSFLENLKFNSRRDNELVSFFVNKKELDNSLEKADDKDELLHTPSAIPGTSKEAEEKAA